MKMMMTVVVAASLWLVTSSASLLQDPQSPQAVEKWCKEHISHAKEKLTKLHFYLHDNITGTSNSTAVQVGQANNNITSNSPTHFGATFVFDDPLTLRPDPNSKIIGRGQGVYSFVSKAELSLMLAFNLVFTHGKYKGSTLTLLGSNSILHKYWEMPILGGTGIFRLARGIATVQTYTRDPSSLKVVAEFDVIVIHYSV